MRGDGGKEGDRERTYGRTMRKERSEGGRVRGKVMCKGKEREWRGEE